MILWYLWVWSRVNQWSWGVTPPVHLRHVSPGRKELTRLPVCIHVVYLLLSWPWRLLFTRTCKSQFTPPDTTRLEGSNWSFTSGGVNWIGESPRESQHIQNNYYSVHATRRRHSTSWRSCCVASVGRCQLASPFTPATCWGNMSKSTSNDSRSFCQQIERNWNEHVQFSATNWTTQQQRTCT